MELARWRSEHSVTPIGGLLVGLDDGPLEKSGIGLRFFNKIAKVSGVCRSGRELSGVTEGRKRLRLFRFRLSAMSNCKVCDIR